jgi:hypothetical protein
MTTINGHTTRAVGTILTAAIYNADHVNHVTNANALNASKIEGPTPPVVDGHVVVFSGTSGSVVRSSGQAPPLLTGNNNFVGDQTITSTDSGATVGPTLLLDRVSASPAASDILGQFTWGFRSSTGVFRTAAAAIGQILSPTNAAEETQWLLQTMTGGALATRFSVAKGAFVGAPTGGDKGVNTFNVAKYYKDGIEDWTLKSQIADQTIASSTTLTNSTSILFSMAVNTLYAFRARIFFDVVAAADFKYAWVGPVSPNYVHMIARDIVGAGTAETVRNIIDFTTIVTLLSPTSGRGYVAFDGIISNGATAGNTVFQFAQNTSDAGLTVVRAGSYVEHRVVS